MAPNVWNYNGNVIHLEKNPIFSCGQGEIYKIQNNSLQQVAKIYKKLDHKKQMKLNDKLLFMIKNPPFSTSTPTEIIDSIVWPTDILYDKQKAFTGFVMPFIHDSKELSILTIASYSNPKDPIWSKFQKSHNNDFFKQRIKIFYNLASVIHEIHKQGNYVLVDLKPPNILINIHGHIALVDIDSIQVNVNSTITFFADAFSDEYCPTEFFTTTKSPIKNKISTSWDIFSLATIGYQLLFQIHPFAGSAKNSQTISNNIRLSLFVHGKNKNKFTVIPAPHNDFHRLDSTLKAHFLNAFESPPNNRYSANKWKITLSKLINNQFNITTSSSSNHAHTTKPHRQATTNTHTGRTVTPSQKSNNNLLVITLGGIALFIVLVLFFRQESPSPNIPIKEQTLINSPPPPFTNISSTKRKVSAENHSQLSLKDTYFSKHSMLTLSNIRIINNQYHFSCTLTSLESPFTKLSTSGRIDPIQSSILIDETNGFIRKYSGGNITIVYGGETFL